jgi:hypothetical protein
MLVLDSGALIAIDRRDRRVGSMLQIARTEGVRVSTSAGAVAQVWRHGARQANLARALTGIRAVALDVSTGKKLGALLGASGSSDVVDAHVAHLVSDGDQVLTSDPDDIDRLLKVRRVRAVVAVV